MDSSLRCLAEFYLTLLCDKNIIIIRQGAMANACSAATGRERQSASGRESRKLREFIQQFG